MSDAIIPVELRRDRDHRSIHDDMDYQLSEMFAVASLLSAIDTDNVGSEQVNVTGSLLQTMITKAKEISHEHYTLWLEELEERRKELAESKKD